MERRSFLKKAGSGLAMGALAMPALTQVGCAAIPAGTEGATPAASGSFAPVSTLPVTGVALSLAADGDFQMMGVAAVGKGLMARSIAKLRARVDPELANNPPVPGQGDAGSAAHNRHQLHYQLIEGAGLLYRITGEAKYAQWAGDLLSRYADQYLQMPFHPQKKGNSPGRLFHQTLNEHMWLLYSAMGYGYIRAALPEAQRQHIENKLFHPMVEMFTVKYGKGFDMVHNHGLWAVAAVGICGLVIGEKRYVDISVHGLAGDDKRGYLAQISKLFSPSGYYVEGPYYHRFAIRPLCLFAEALHLHRPDLDIYRYKGGVIGNTVRALLSTAYPNGAFPALNDASRTMSIRDEGLLIAAAVYHARYAQDATMAAVARQQDEVWPMPCALGLATAADKLPADAKAFWGSVELNEGGDGNRGAQGFMRAKNAAGDITQLNMKYGQHGMGHGHFDMLGITLFNRGEEMLRDYGFGRWVNIETKFGGRYLRENNSWATQTVAHNCVVVDQQCQKNGSSNEADKANGVPHFFIGQGAMQGMSAFAYDYYPGVAMQRSVLLLTLPGFDYPVVVDLFRLKSNEEHRYDYALQYQGQITDSNLPLKGFTKQWNVLGEKAGYQHLLGVSEANVTKGGKITWLQGDRFNTFVTAAEQAKLTLAMVGGNDPDLNLRNEKTLLLTQTGKTHLFASAFETHGLFDESKERCFDSISQLQKVQVLGHSDEGSVVIIETAKRSWLVMVSNKAGVQPDTAHQVAGQTWQGAFKVIERSV